MLDALDWLTSEARESEDPGAAAAASAAALRALARAAGPSPSALQPPPPDTEGSATPGSSLDSDREASAALRRRGSLVRQCLAVGDDEAAAAALAAMASTGGGDSGPAAQPATAAWAAPELAALPPLRRLVGMAARAPLLPGDAAARALWGCLLAGTAAAASLAGATAAPTAVVDVDAERTVGRALEAIAGAAVSGGAEPAQGTAGGSMHIAAACASLVLALAAAGADDDDDVELRSAAGAGAEATGRHGAAFGGADDGTAVVAVPAGTLSALAWGAASAAGPAALVIAALGRAGAPSDAGSLRAACCVVLRARRDGCLGPKGSLPVTASSLRGAWDGLGEGSRSEALRAAVAEAERACGPEDATTGAGAELRRPDAPGGVAGARIDDAAGLPPAAGPPQAASQHPASAAPAHARLPQARTSPHRLAASDAGPPVTASPGLNRAFDRLRRVREAASAVGGPPATPPPEPAQVPPVSTPPRREAVSPPRLASALASRPLLPPVSSSAMPLPASAAPSPAQLRLAGLPPTDTPPPGPGRGAGAHRDAGRGVGSALFSPFRTDERESSRVEPEGVAAAHGAVAQSAGAATRAENAARRLAEAEASAAQAEAEAEAAEAASHAAVAEATARRERAAEEAAAHRRAAAEAEAAAEAARGQAQQARDGAAEAAEAAAAAARALEAAEAESLSVVRRAEEAGAAAAAAQAAAQSRIDALEHDTEQSRSVAAELEAELDDLRSHIEALEREAESLRGEAEDAEATLQVLRRHDGATGRRKEAEAEARRAEEEADEAEAAAAAALRRLDASAAAALASGATASDQAGPAFVPGGGAGVAVRAAASALRGPVAGTLRQRGKARMVPGGAGSDAAVGTAPWTPRHVTLPEQGAEGGELKVWRCGRDGARMGGEPKASWPLSSVSSVGLRSSADGTELVVTVERGADADEAAVAAVAAADAGGSEEPSPLRVTVVRRSLVFRAETDDAAGRGLLAAWAAALTSRVPSAAGTLGGADAGGEDTSSAAAGVAARALLAARQSLDEANERAKAAEGDADAARQRAAALAAAASATDEALTEVRAEAQRWRRAAQAASLRSPRGQPRSPRRDPSPPGQTNAPTRPGAGATGARGDDRSRRRNGAFVLPRSAVVRVPTMTSIRKAAGVQPETGAAAGQSGRPVDAASCGGGGGGGGVTTQVGASGRGQGARAASRAVKRAMAAEAACAKARERATAAEKSLAVATAEAEAAHDRARRLDALLRRERTRHDRGRGSHARRAAAEAAPAAGLAGTETARSRLVAAAEAVSALAVTSVTADPRSPPRPALPSDLPPESGEAAATPGFAADRSGWEVPGSRPGAPTPPHPGSVAALPSRGEERATGDALPPAQPARPRTLPASPPAPYDSPSRAELEAVLTSLEATSARAVTLGDGLGRERELRQAAEAEAAAVAARAADLESRLSRSQGLAAREAALLAAARASLRGTAADVERWGDACSRAGEAADAAAERARAQLGHLSHAMERGRADTAAAAEAARASGDLASAAVAATDAAVTAGGHVSRSAAAELARALAVSHSSLSAASAVRERSSGSAAAAATALAALSRCLDEVADAAAEAGAAGDAVRASADAARHMAAGAASPSPRPRQAPPSSSPSPQMAWGGQTDVIDATPGPSPSPDPAEPAADKRAAGQPSSAERWTVNGSKATRSGGDPPSADSEAGPAAKPEAGGTPFASASQAALRRLCAALHREMTHDTGPPERGSDSARLRRSALSVAPAEGVVTLRRLGRAMQRSGMLSRPDRPAPPLLPLSGLPEPPSSEPVDGPTWLAHARHTVHGGQGSPLDADAVFDAVCVAAELRYGRAAREAAGRALLRDGGPTEGATAADVALGLGGPGWAAAALHVWPLVRAASGGEAALPAKDAALLDAAAVFGVSGAAPTGRRIEI